MMVSYPRLLSSYSYQFPTHGLPFTSTMKFSFATVASIFLAAQAAAIPAETAEVRSLLYPEYAMLTDPLPLATLLPPPRHNCTPLSRIQRCGRESLLHHQPSGMAEHRRPRVPARGYGWSRLRFARGLYHPSSPPIQPIPHKPLLHYQ